ncbi:MAG: hypothetical protein AAF557_10940 [Pseudomonadota bacterium]
MQTYTPIHLRRLLSGSVVLFALSLITISAVTSHTWAGMAHPEWPDAIICTKKSDGDVVSRFVLPLVATQEGELQPCGFPPGKTSVKRAIYSIVFNCGFVGAEMKFECTDVKMDMCTESVTSRAEPEIAPADFDDCRLGRSLEQMEAGGQTINLKH